MKLPLLAILWLGLGSLVLWQLQTITFEYGINEYLAGAIGVVLLLAGGYYGVKAYIKLTG